MFTLTLGGFDSKVKSSITVHTRYLQIWIQTMEKWKEQLESTYQYNAGNVSLMRG